MESNKTKLSKKNQWILICFLIAIMSIVLICYAYTLSVVRSFIQYSKESAKQDTEEVWNFAYTGGVQIFTAPKTGKYHFEIYGASGGNASTDKGGCGGYSEGDYTILAGETIYIVVGGQGTSNTGGYNGGGSAPNAYGGGGATHIATQSGLLSSLGEKRDAVLLVAGGGGGAGKNMLDRINMIGSAGGETGQTTNLYAYSAVPSWFYAANQEKGYAFGQGGPGTNGGGAGGGGWFGGIGLNTYESGGCGGSGHVSNQIDNGNTNYSKHIGNGSAKIEYSGPATTTVTLNLLNGATFNNKSTIDVTGELGGFTNLDLNIKEGYELIGWNVKSGDSTIEGKKIIFGRAKGTIEAVYKASLEIEQVVDGNVSNLICIEDDNINKTYKIYSSVDNVNWDIADTTNATYEREIKTETFNYTGEIQQYVIPYTGNYVIEMYGGSGGKSIVQGESGTNIGYGGYSYGIGRFEQGDVIYIAVGGQGASGNLRGNAKGGWNGGGYGTNDSGADGTASDNEASGGGGGATSITTKLRGNGTLVNYKDYKDEVLMVAGGGGGASYNFPAGNGGGVCGGPNSTGLVANQTSGYAFGQGQNGYGKAESDGVGGGGGGWYGGHTSNTSFYSAGGGGSGYIGNISNGKTSTSNHTGNGVVTITYESTSYDEESIKAIVLTDNSKPSKPNNIDVVEQNNKLAISWQAEEDSGTVNYFKAESYDKDSNELLNTSNIVSHMYTSGVKGFLYVIDTAENTIVTSGNSQLVENSSLQIDKPHVNSYIHIASVDNSGNISETVSYQLVNVGDYKVEYYIQNKDMEVEGYDLLESETVTKTGPIGEIVTVQDSDKKIINGFTYQNSNYRNVLSTTVLEDGTASLKLYYKRNEYSISYELNGGQAQYLTTQYLYGKEFILSRNITNSGKRFVGWYDNPEFNGEEITKISEGEFGDKTFYAKWSDEEFYIRSNKYEIDKNNNMIFKVSPNTTINIFKANINTNGVMTVVDTNDTLISENGLVYTGSILKVEYAGTVYTFDIVVRGDINGDGKVTLADLSLINQVLVGKTALTGLKEKAADINFDGNKTLVDLSLINQAIVGKITL